MFLMAFISLVVRKGRSALCRLTYKIIKMKRITKLNKIAFAACFAFFLAGMAQLATSCNNAPASEETASEEPPVHKEVDPLARGKELYVSYCQICHGEHGDGAMAELLKIQPPDLTLIAARRDGNFPAEQIRKIIDGTEPVEGHGSGDMPIWGVTFKVSENLGDDEQVKKEIQNIVIYLQSIQREAPAGEAPAEGEG